MAVKDANKKHYFDTIPKDEMPTLLSEFDECGVEVKLWEKGAHEKVEDFAASGSVADEKRLIIDKQGGFMSKLTGSSLSGKEIFFKATIGRYQYFTTSVLDYDEEKKEYSVVLKNDIFRSQQRTNYRLPKSSNVQIQFKIDDEVFDCEDISAGGTSFKIPESEKDRFPKEEEFYECTLRLNRYKCEIEHCKIAGVWEDKDALGQPSGLIGLGIAFLEYPTEEDEEKLFQEINGEARAEEMRKMMAKRAAEKAK